MSKARTLANLMSDNAELADGQIGVAEVVGAAPLASPSFTGNLAVTGTVDGVDIAARDAVLTSTTTTAGAALPKAGGTMTGALNIQFSNNDGGVSGQLVKNTNTGTTANFASVSYQAVNGGVQGTFGAAHYPTWGGSIAFAGSQTNHPFNIVTNNAVRMSVTSGGNVGIGNASPDSLLNIEATKTTALSSMAHFLTLGLTVDDDTAYNNAGIGGGIAFRGIRDTSGNQTVYGAIDAGKEDTANGSYKGSLKFYTNNNSTGVPTEHLRIDSSGNVGIGTTSPVSLSGQTSLTINGTSVARLDLQSTGQLFANGTEIVLQGSFGKPVAIDAGTNQHISFRYATAEKMKLDTSGRLLVGKNASGAGNVGAEMRTGVSDHAIVAVTSGNASPLAINRQTGGSGNLINMYVANSPKGNIGIDNNDPYIARVSGNGMRFISGAAIPCTETGGNANAAMDLGHTSVGFRDLYLTGGVRFDTNGEFLDDYEEGTWTPVMKDGAANQVITSGSNYGNYTKIGRLVRVNGSVERNTGSNFTSILNMASLPFTSANITSNLSIDGAAWSDHASGTDPTAIIYVGANDTRAYFKTMNGSAVYWTSNLWQNGRPIYFSFSYLTA